MSTFIPTLPHLSSAGRCSIANLLYPGLLRTPRRSSPVHPQTLPTFHCNDLTWRLVCRCGGIQSNNMTKQCLVPLADYICNAWQTGPVSYVDVPHMVLPLHTQYMALALAWHMERLESASVVCQPTLWRSESDYWTLGFSNLKWCRARSLMNTNVWTTTQRALPLTVNKQTGTLKNLKICKNTANCMQ